MPDVLEPGMTTGGEAPPPLARLLGLALDNLSRQLQERIREAGFTDQRMAHNAVFAHVPPEGITLADLSRRAGMTKQAMSELVADLEHKGYLTRRPDDARQAHEDHRAEREGLGGRERRRWRPSRRSSTTSSGTSGRAGWEELRRTLERLTT